MAADKKNVSPRLYTIQEVMSYIGISRRTVYNYVDRQVCSYIVDANTGRRMFSQQEVDKIVAWRIASTKAKQARCRKLTAVRQAKQQTLQAASPANFNVIFRQPE